MGGGSSSSSSDQYSEGDLVFNNIDYGQNGAGDSPLKNFNVGRSNTLKGNVFNVTDEGATKNALAAAVEVANNANNAVKSGAEFALDKNAEISLKALGEYSDVVEMTGDQVTDAQVTSAQATGKALDYVFESSKTATERQSESLIKYGTYGAIALVGTIALTAAMKGAQ